MSHSKPTSKLCPGLVLSCLALLAAAPGRGETSYSYVRIVDGPATLLADDGERDRIDVQQPILVGDRLWVPYDSRLEVVLSDRTLLRLGGETEVLFERIAWSADTEDRRTVLRLVEGHLQLVVPDYALGDTWTQIEAPNATIYLHREGLYRVTFDRNGWTELVVRQGLAELVTSAESRLVHAGEMGIAEGHTVARLSIRPAERRDALEVWGDRLSEEAALVDPGYVDDSLRYAAAPLAHHGTWVSIDSRRAWRPRVEVAWRPYYRGYWRTTPIGPTWVSYDPWGWVTHHYGSWDYVQGYGWVWYPGPTFAPARVHWYWGPSYVGWCPSGFYDHHYRRHHHGFHLHFGIYGWAGGSWDHFAHWSFTATADFGRRHHHHRRHVYSGFELAAKVRAPRLDLGIITAQLPDPIRLLRRPHEVFRVLKDEATRDSRRIGRGLPDVTDFVARRPLRDDVARTVLRKGENRDSTRRGSSADRRVSSDLRSARPIQRTVRSDKLESLRQRAEPDRVYRGERPRVGYDDRAPGRRTGPSDERSTSRMRTARPPAAEVDVRERRPESDRSSRRSGVRERRPESFTPVARPERVTPRSEPPQRRTSEPSSRSSRPRATPSERRERSPESFTPVARPERVTPRSEPSRRPGSEPSSRSSRPSAKPSERRSSPAVRSHRPDARPERPTGHQSSRRVSEPPRRSEAASRPSSGSSRSSSGMKSTAPSRPRPSARPQRGTSNRSSASRAERPSRSRASGKAASRSKAGQRKPKKKND